MRAAVLFSLIACLLTAPTVQASTLSRARSAARNHDFIHERDHRNAGELARAQREARKDRKEQRKDRDDHRHRGGSYHHPPQHYHGGGAFGFFGFNRCEPCCPPTVVETHIYHEPIPVYTAEPVVVPPVYPEIIEPAAVNVFVRQFAPYPYANDCDGLMLTGSPGCGKSWSGRVQFELGSDFDGVDRNGAGFMVEGIGGLGFDFNWDSYTEDLPGGRHDELHVGEIDMLYRVAETDLALVHVGLGTVWLGDRYDTDFGVNFTLKADFAPSDPIVLSGELDLGTLGDAEHVHAAGTIGVMLNRCELYGGYDYRRIGNATIDGPMIGLRVWF